MSTTSVHPVTRLPPNAPRCFLRGWPHLVQAGEPSHARQPRVLAVAPGGRPAPQIRQFTPFPSALQRPPLKPSLGRRAGLSGVTCPVTPGDIAANTLASGSFGHILDERGWISLSRWCSVRPPGQEDGSDGPWTGDRQVWESLTSGANAVALGGVKTGLSPGRLRSWLGPTLYSRSRPPSPCEGAEPGEAERLGRFPRPGPAQPAARAPRPVSDAPEPTGARRPHPWTGSRSPRRSRPSRPRQSESSPRVAPRDGRARG
jgi:hypothetical protein